MKKEVGRAHADLKRIEKTLTKSYKGHKYNVRTSTV